MKTLALGRGAGHGRRPPGAGARGMMASPSAARLQLPAAPLVLQQSKHGILGRSLLQGIFPGEVKK